MKYIFEYEFKGKKYVAYFANSEIRFGVEIDGVIDNRLDKEESFIIKSIYSYIVGKKEDFLELSPITINNIQLKIFYNEKNRLYSFYQIIDNMLVNPDEVILENLNYIFNNQNIKYSKDSEGKESSKKKFKLIAKIAGTVVIIFVSSSIVLSSLAISSLPIVIEEQNMFNADYYLSSTYKNLHSKQDNSNFSYDEIEETIRCNQNLTDEEKNFLINGLRNEIEENIDYIDVDNLKSNLSKLYINYYPSIVIDENGEEQIIINGLKGAYSTFGTYKDCLELWGDKEHVTKDFTDCNKDDFIHEINHVLNKQPFILTLPGDLGNKFEKLHYQFGWQVDRMLEIINELFSREYSLDFNITSENIGYDEQMPIGYALCEILDESVLRKYKFDSDNFYITNYLTSIGVDKYYAYDLYKSLNLSHSQFYSLNSTTTEAEYSNNNHNIYNIIKYCYEQKYDNSMEDDLVMMSYFYNTIYVDEKFNQRYREILGVDSIEKIIPKGYFSETYKKENPTVTVIVNGNESIAISEENRYVNTSKLK